MKTHRMTAGKYVITDACMSYDDYYQNFLIDGHWSNVEGEKMGSSFIRGTGSDGGWIVRDMNNNIVGYTGADAANVSVIPQAVIKGPIPNWYGTYIEFDEDFDIVVYHDSIVIGNKYRVRMPGVR